MHLGTGVGLVGGAAWGVALLSLVCRPTKTVDDRATAFVHASRSPPPSGCGDTQRGCTTPLL